MLLKNMSSEISVVVLTDICVFRFSILVSADTQKCILRDIPQNTGSHTTLYCILDTSVLFLFLRTYMAPNSLTLHKPVSVVACVKSF